MSWSSDEEEDQAARPKSFGDKFCFGHDVFLCYPPDSSLANHVHAFDALERSLRNREGIVAFGQPDPLFRNAVILFNHIIEELTLT